MADKKMQQKHDKEQDGGKVKSSKSVSKSTTKPSSKSPSKSSSKKGGALMNDVQNLAVPFAILLAKEGLSKMFKSTEEKPSKTSKKTGTTTSAKSASSSKSMRRRSTMNGGSCNLGCGAMTGGEAAKQLFELQKQIDNFLEKY
jgi:hypothetical protein